MTDPQTHWNERYEEYNIPWDSGQASEELRRVLSEFQIEPCRTLEPGCGTGTNAVYLAQQGFQVTAFDVAPLAVEQARAKAEAEKVAVDFSVSDVAHPPPVDAPFPFVFDRGVYHVLRRDQPGAFLQMMERVTETDSLWLTLAGNADEKKLDDGPPTLSAAEICREIEPLFSIQQLRAFHFDATHANGESFRPLAWSILSRRR